MDTVGDKPALLPQHLIYKLAEQIFRVHGLVKRCAPRDIMHQRLQKFSVNTGYADVRR